MAYTAFTYSFPWQLTPVLLPGKSHGLRSLVGYCPWGCKESDMTEWLHFTSLPNLEPVHCSTSGSKCCFLACMQISHEADKVVWYSYLLQKFPQFVVIHIVKPFSVGNKAEADVFLKLSCFFYDPADTGNLITGFSAFSKSSLNIWDFSVHILLKPSLEILDHYFDSMWGECNCMVIWSFFVVAFLWDWNENWPFPVLWPLLSFPNLLAYRMQHFHSSIF